MSDTIRKLGLDKPGTYEIKVPGRLDEDWSEWFEGMTITVEAGTDCPTITTLTGIVADEAALQGLLDRLYSLGLRLLSVRRIEPAVEAPVGRREYDFVLAGGGVAGLSLAYHLAQSPLRDRSILIVDREAKDRNDRTLSFWTREPTLFDGIVYRSWSRLRFVGQGLEKEVELDAYRYRMIRGIEFYRFVRQELSACSNVEFLQGRVERIEDGDERATVSVDGQVYRGRWIFDSRFRPVALNPNPARYHTLQWHFKGWLIETQEAAFDPRAAIPFDFRTPQSGEMRFFYVLPLSERQALVEYVLHSEGEYAPALETYLERVLGIQDYQILAEEGGTLPMTDQPFTRQVGRRIMTVGIPGGRVKPTSGYAFLRIQQDSAAIVQSLLREGHPFDVPGDSGLYRSLDSLMLQVMHRHGDEIKPIFAELIKNNPIDRVFRFLDETASLWDTVMLMASLPPWRFLQALYRLKVLHRI